NLALGRTEIATVGPGAWAHRHTTTDQIVPSWPPGWVDSHLYPLAAPNLKRLKRANRLAAGHRGNGTAVLYVNQSPELGLVDQANVIFRQLKKIGLAVSTVPLGVGALELRAGTRGEPYDMVLTRYFLQYPDPANVLIRLLGGKNASKPIGNTNFAYF